MNFIFAEVNTFYNNEALKITIERNGWIEHWNTVLVVIDNNQVIGTGQEKIIPRLNGTVINVLSTIWIKESYRGNKLGQIIAKKIIENSKANIIWLECKPYLETYYKNLGFIIGDRAEVIPEFIDDDYDDGFIVMKRNLNV